MDQAKDSVSSDYKALSVISGYSPAPNGNPHILNASSDKRYRGRGKTISGIKLFGLVTRINLVNDCVRKHEHT